jgi:hypothetical protein
MAPGWEQEDAMLSKCANPACSQVFRYLRQGKIFHLSLTPAMQASTKALKPSLHERFWLCNECAKEMTLVWGGAEAKVVPLHGQSGAKDQHRLPQLAGSHSRARRKGARIADHSDA